MLLRISSDNEGRNVHYLLADADVALANQHTGVVDGLGEPLLEDLGLQAAFQESLSSKLQDIIQRVLLVGHQAESLESADQGGGLEQSLGVLGVKGQQGTGSL